MGNEKTLATLKKSDRVEIRLTVSEFNDQEYVHIRQYQRNDDQSDFAPTKKGVAVNLEDAERLVDMFQELAKELELRKNGDDCPF